MASIALERADVIVGVDTHKDQHVAKLGSAGCRAIDAEHAARSVLAGTATVTPKLADGQVEAIRLVKIARDTAVKSHSTAIITLKAVLEVDPGVVEVE